MAVVTLILILNWSLDSVDRDNITIDIKLWLFQLQDGQQYSFRLAEGYPWTDCPEKGYSRSLYSLRYMSPSRLQNSGKFFALNPFSWVPKKNKSFWRWCDKVLFTETAIEWTVSSFVIIAETNRSRIPNSVLMYRDLSIVFDICLRHFITVVLVTCFWRPCDVTVTK